VFRPRDVLTTAGHLPHPNLISESEHAGMIVMMGQKAIVTRVITISTPALSLESLHHAPPRTIVVARDLQRIPRCPSTKSLTLGVRGMVVLGHHPECHGIPRHNPRRSRSRVPDSQQRKRKPGRYDDPNTDDELHNRSRSPPLERDLYQREKEPRRFNHDKQICKATMATVTVPKSEAVSPMIIDDDSDEIPKTVETRHPKQPSDSTITTTTESKKEDVSQAHTVDLESLDEPSSTAYSTASDSTKLAAEDRPARFPPASVDAALSSRSRQAPSALLLPIDAVVQPEADLLSLCHCGRRVNTGGMFTWGVNPSRVTLYAEVLLWNHLFVICYLGSIPHISNRSCDTELALSRLKPTLMEPT